MKYEIFFDGACHNVPEDPNPIMGIGMAVFADGRYCPDFSEAENYRHHIIRGTNNIAEWRGAVIAMRFASQLKQHITLDEQIIVYSDSQIIAEQFNGRYQIKDDNFKEFYEQAKEFAKIAGVERIEWIPRERNRYADVLSKIGRKYLKVNEIKGLIEIDEHTVATKRSSKSVLKAYRFVEETEFAADSRLLLKGTIINYEL